MNRTESLTIGIGLATIAIAVYFAKQTSANVGALARQLGIGPVAAQLHPPTSLGPVVNGGDANAPDPPSAIAWDGYEFVGPLLPPGYDLETSVYPVDGRNARTVQNGADYTLHPSENPTVAADYAVSAPGTIVYSDGSVDISNGAPQPGISIVGLEYGR